LIIFAIVAIGVVVVALGGYGGRRRYQKMKGGGAGDNPKSHRGHNAKNRHDHRGRGGSH